MRGCFIAFEGRDGSGKSTQARLLADDIGALLTREPGGTHIGERIREVLLDTELSELRPRTEALLMAASRAQHVDEVVEPALAAGRHVVSDRYIASSLAYQGAGRGLGVAEIATLNEWGTDGLVADINVLLDVDAAESSERRRSLTDDRIEAADGDFHSTVGDAFGQLAADRPTEWVVVDGRGSIEDVAARVRAAVAPVLARTR